MSDQLLNQFVAIGTTAEIAAVADPAPYTPPAGTLRPLYLWYDETTNTLYAGDGTAGKPADPISGGGGGAAKPFITFIPVNNEPPSANMATPGLVGNHPCLDFDQTTAESAIWTGVLSNDYAGGGLTVQAMWSCGVNAGTVGWLVAIERIEDAVTNLTADSFAADQTITAETVPGTVGIAAYSSVAITNGANMDNLAAGEAFRIRITRDVSVDTAAGDARLIALSVRET